MSVAIKGCDSHDVYVLAFSVAILGGAEVISAGRQRAWHPSLAHKTPQFL